MGLKSLGKSPVKKFIKEFKQLCQTYDKVLKNDHSTNFKSLINPMSYFVDYLKFMRDYYILTEPLVLDSEEENLKIATIATAISEYEQYQNCERYEFYKTQISDAEKSRDELRSLIKSLMNQMRTIFLDRFTQIAGNFAVVFCELFGGGEWAEFQIGRAHV